MHTKCIIDTIIKYGCIRIVIPYSNAEAGKFKFKFDIYTQIIIGVKTQAE
jgi:hypothetical protein